MLYQHEEATEMNKVARVALMLAMLLFLPMAAAATNQVSSPCSDDTFLVQPVSSIGGIPQSTLTAFGLDGTVRAEFPMNQPVSAFAGEVPGRALVQLADQSLQIVDIVSGASTPVDVEQYEREGIQVNPNFASS